MIQEYILLADNNKEYCDGSRMNLEERGHNVVTVNNADGAIQLLRNRLFDRIFLDTLECERGEYTGMQVLNFTKDFFPSNRIIASERYTDLYPQDRLSQYSIMGYYGKLGGSNKTIAEWVEEDAMREQEGFKFQAGGQEIEVIDPFGFPSSYKEYLDLEKYKQLYRYFENYSEKIYMELIKQQFNATGANTLVFCDHEKVLESKTPYVSSDKIREIETEREKLCYVIGRDIIEETEEVETSRWGIISDDDSYPTVLIYLSKKESSQKKQRAHFADQIFHELQQVEQNCGEPLAAVYVDSLFSTMRAMRDLFPTDSFVEVLMAIYDAMAANNNWCNLQPNQFREAASILKDTFDRKNITAHDVEQAILSLEEIGFDTTPFGGKIDEE